jgi:hypothetical protein
VRRSAERASRNRALVLGRGQGCSSVKAIACAAKSARNWQVNWYEYEFNVGSGVSAGRSQQAGSVLAPGAGRTGCSECVSRQTGVREPAWIQKEKRKRVASAFRACLKQSSMLLFHVGLCVVNGEHRVRVLDHVTRFAF